MIGASRVQTNGTEPIGALVVDSSGALLAGLNNLKLYVRRVSDGFYLDWTDQTFKALPAQMLLILKEADSISSPGFYHIDSSPHSDGLFQFSALINKAADDTYIFTVIQDGVVQTASNVPQIGEVREGGWIDYVDQAISDNATPAEVKAELVALGLDHLVSVNPGIVPPASGTYIRQVLDRLDQKPEYLVLQSYGYSKADDKIRGSVWVENQNLILVDADATVVVEWVDAETDTVLWSVADPDIAPDARGFFYVEKDAPGIAQGKVYYARATVTLVDSTVLQGGKGSFTF